MGLGFGLEGYFVQKVKSTIAIGVVSSFLGF